MNRHDDESLDYACIDPALGALLERPAALSADEELQLAEHLELCQACRVVQVMHSVLSQQAVRRTGRALQPRFGWDRIFSLAAALSLIAALAAMLLLRPSPQSRFGGHGDLVERGEAVLAISAPFEGEVLGPRGGTLSWNALSGASHYNVRLARRGNAESLEYSGVEETSLALPPLPAGEYLAELKALPDHVAGNEPARVAFRRGSWPEFFTYRLRHLSGAAIALFGAAIALGGAALSRRLR